MKKYIAFAKVILKQQFKKLSDVFGTLLSFTIHISIFSLLWDFVLEGKTMDQLTEELMDYVVSVASGEKTKNEIHGYEEISIFKDGVTL